MKEKIKRFTDEIYIYENDLKGMKKFGLVLLLLFLISASSMLAAKEASAQEACPLKNAEIFKSINLKTLDGERFTSEDIKGYDIIIVDFWATDCFHCVEDMPMLARFNNALPNFFPDSKILIIGLLGDVYTTLGDYYPENIQIAKKISDNAGVKYQQLIADSDMLNLIKPYFTGFPTVFYLDNEGNVLDTTAGLQEAGYMLKIKALLDAKGA